MARVRREQGQLVLAPPAQPLAVAPALDEPMPCPWLSSYSVVASSLTVTMFPLSADVHAVAVVIAPGVVGNMSCQARSSAALGNKRTQKRVR
ncbi:hypothetical protein C2845_PM13G04020 [Panicum miliaceum]|uniref:Uncharacterized protein n=1 Tax=Panicum miliaceum TaxID=4540 RepID=A0A3L6RIL5_PANMI|nr:hypothetical protein C2845_PM13G04020 [Panicum miliaceum]